jgi:ribonuclease HI
MGKVKHEIIDWFMLLIYNLWLARNDARESQSIEDPRCIVRRTMAGMEEWREIHKPKDPKKVVRGFWRPPSQDQIKINVDGAFKANASVGGGGAVLRDGHGGFVRGSCCFFPQVMDAEGFELLACKQGLILAQEAQARKIVVETDSAVVASKLRSEGQDRSIYGSLVEDLKTLLHGFQETTISLVRRSANGVAHSLAQEGCVNKRCNTWVEVPPDLVVNRLSLDLFGV